MGIAHRPPPSPTTRNNCQYGSDEYGNCAPPADSYEYGYGNNYEYDDGIAPPDYGYGSDYSDSSYYSPGYY